MKNIRIPGPVPAPVDLRNMLREHLARRVAGQLHQAAARREAALAEPAKFAEWARGVRTAAANMLGLRNLRELPLNTRLVSRHEHEHCVVENVIFESLDRWQVNASVFIPRKCAEHRPPYPAVVVPVGHSPKTGPNYQLPCQLFARAGYVAVVFDPPGQQTEKDPGNDHFTDGPRCYAVGQSPLRYFVADALRALDYLETRPDVDSSRGFAMTGVSGGGETTRWAAALDDRVRVAVPVCAAAPIFDHPLLDRYSNCPEPTPLGRLAEGIDDVDLMAALAPTPQMYMAGSQDDVSTLAMTERINAEVSRAYAAVGAPNAFQRYVENADHCYSISMARRFVMFANEFLLGEPGRKHSAACDSDPELLPAESMLCHPAPEPNMRTISSARAEALSVSRPRVASRDDAARCVRALVPDVDTARIENVRRGGPNNCWRSAVEEVLLEHEDGICLPATLCWPRRQKPWPAVVMFDERGRWGSLARNGWLAIVSRFLDYEAAAAPAVMSVDLRGWGDSAPAPGPYDLAPWARPDRMPNYIADSLDDSLMAQRVRDGLAACRWLVEQDGVDAARLVLAGHGLGSVVALMVAAMCEHVLGVVCVEGPASVAAAVGEPDQAWPLDIFMPRMLEHCDIADLSGVVGAVLNVRAKDARCSVVKDASDNVIAPWIWERLGL